LLKKLKDIYPIFHVPLFMYLPTKYKMTVYPTLNQFWPAVRARNFVKELGLKPGNYTKNMETLSVRAGVHPKQMSRVNPLTFAEREIGCDHVSLVGILGKNTYAQLDMERHKTWGSASWAYHKKDPIPSWSQWQIEIDTILYLCKKIDAAVPFSPTRVSLAGALFIHLLRYEPFLRANPQVCHMAAQKVAEFKAIPCAAPIMSNLVAMEELLERIRPSAAPEPAAPEPAAPEPEPSAEFLFDMGCQYENGITVEKNLSEAVRHYILAAEKGYAKAQCTMGFFYENGVGVARDAAEAVRYYTLAANAGHVIAQHNLGYCYAKGTGVKKDLAASLRYYILAAEAGHAASQVNLGFCYERGVGVARDAAAAVRWYTEAAEAGHEQAKYRLHLLAPPAGSVVVNLSCCLLTFWT